MASLHTYIPVLHRCLGSNYSISSLDQRFSSIDLGGTNQDEGGNIERVQVSEQVFDPRRCLFCRHDSVDLDGNLEHMNKKHGLFIPDVDRLVVDLQTLVGYFHLVV